jgi:hypothetical protein
MIWRLNPLALIKRCKTLDCRSLISNASRT